MLSLSSDVRSYMINFIKSDHDKCRLLMTCKRISECNFYFTKNINTCFIINSRWFDHFTNVNINRNNTKLPLNVTYLTFNCNFNKPINDYIPSTVTHLRLYCADEFINKQLPISIMHLSYDGHDKKIFQYLPLKLNELKFNSYIFMIVPGPIFIELMKGNFPSSVKKIIFRNHSSNKLEIFIPNIEISFEN